MESLETLERSKEIINEAIDEVTKERDWVLREYIFIKKVLHAAEEAQDQQTVGGINIKKTRKFERKAARSEVRVNRSENKVINILEALKQRFPDWSGALTDLQQQTSLFNKNILRRVSSLTGTIPQFIKKNDLNGIISEAGKVMNDGVRPLVALLNHLLKELGIHLKEEKIAVRIREHELDERTEAWLNRWPFFITFHGANEKVFVNGILAEIPNLPTSYGGRTIEYVLEVDYIWYVRDFVDPKTKMNVIDPRTGKPKKMVRAFFGHANRLKMPTKASKIRDMSRGSTDPEKLKKSGLMAPEWLFARAGRVKLMIEIKAGRGKFVGKLDEIGLDYLVELIKSYHLEDRVLFLASAWALDYLKQRLPNCVTVLPTFKTFFGSVLNIPLQKSITSLWKFGPGLFTMKGRMGLIDCYFKYQMPSEEAVMKQIKQTTKDKKFLYGAMVKRKEQFQWLIQHGGRGCLIYKWPHEIYTWLQPPPAVRR